ncbi:MAG: NAD(P)-binding domain-containing protein, partial [Pseudomonadota bacterium]
PLAVRIFESGIDAAYHLAQRNKRVRVFDSRSPWDSTSSEPSVVLSPFTVGRMRSPAFGDHVTLHANTIITAITRENDEYVVRALGGVTHRTQAQPLWAGGFDGGHRLVEDLFEQRQDGFPLLNEHDESTITPGLFVYGPLVRHDDHIFCFINKYRQRFAVVAKAIANSLGVHAEGLEMYRTWGMFLDDLSCCGEECVC